MTMEQDYIEVQNVRHHNLKGFSLKIPLNQFTVITGVSGSGKSSLAFDTLFAEGQRRYIESLSSYARQFLGKIPKPTVQAIKGLPPSVAIQQKVATSNPRSTVGTVSEVYDYIKLLFARIGKTYCPETNEEIKKHTISDVVAQLSTLEPNQKIAIIAPITLTEKTKQGKLLEQLIKDGYSRYLDGEKIKRIEDLSPKDDLGERLLIVVDRFKTQADDDNQRAYYFDSVTNAYNLGQEHCIIRNFDTGDIYNFSAHFEHNGKRYQEPSTHLFDFNNPIGACHKCEGYGKILDIDEKLVIPDSRKSIVGNAVAPWATDKMSQWRINFLKQADAYNFPAHTPYNELTAEQKHLLWHGNSEVEGIFDFFKMVEGNLYKIQYRVMFARYRARTTCRHCKGSRLNPDALNVRMHQHTIDQIVNLPIDELIALFKNIKLTAEEKEIASLLTEEIQNRLATLHKLGLSYLTLNRVSSTLSGGEYQRINLANCLNSQLVGTLYVLDEPSIGLHPKDTENLIQIIHELKDLGNTLVVVEHDELIMKHADHIIDIGPRAGNLGGELMYSGSTKAFLSKPKDTLTWKYLSSELQINLDQYIPTESKDSLSLRGINKHNLHNLDVTIPLNKLVTVTGVSGSGKSTLVRDVLLPCLEHHFGIPNPNAEGIAELQINSATLKGVEYMDQNPIGKSSRSNAITYIGAYDEIRALMAKLQLSKINGFATKHFSFNVDGGRCPVCKGEGHITLEMQFMADVTITCEECEGKRFKKDVLEVEYQGKNIYDILEMTIQEAYDFFDKHKNTAIANKIKHLTNVGLGYLKVGQPANTLSGGEAQRVKLATFLSQEKENTNKIYIFDEPTTGLHYADIQLLMESFYQLIRNNNSVILVEHNTEVIKNTDWIIDLGPDAGKHGGQLVFEGTPQAILKTKGHTAQALAES